MDPMYEVGTEVSWELPNARPTGVISEVMEVLPDGSVRSGEYTWDVSEYDNKWFVGEIWYVVDREVPEPGGPEALPERALEAV